MLQIQLIRENPQFVIDRLKVKHFDAEGIISEISQLDVDIRQNKKSLDDNLMEQKKLSAEIGKLFKEGKANEAAAMKARIAELKEVEKQLQAKVAEAADKIQERLFLMPNLPPTCPTLPCRKAKPPLTMKSFTPKATPPISTTTPCPTGNW